MTDFTELTTERDEVVEVRKLSHKATARVRTWRLLVTLALLLTAVAVTLTTYFLLVDQEDENFRNVVRGFWDLVIEGMVIDCFVSSWFT